MLFTQIRRWRKDPRKEAGPLVAEMMARLKPSWYAVYWLKRKIDRLKKNILKPLR